MKLKPLLLTPLLLFCLAFSVQTTATDTTYGPVKPNDNLWGISGQFQATQGGRLLQWMQAFYNANPDSFIKGNINLLKQGINLVAPTLQQVEAIDERTALKTLVLHNTLLRAGNPAIPAPTATSEEAQSFQQRNSELLGQIQTLTQQMEGMKGQSSEQQKQVSGLKNQLSELQTQLSQARAENAELKARSQGDSAAQTEATKLRKELEEKLQARIKELETLLSQSKARAAELEEGLKGAEQARIQADQAAATAKSEKEMRLEAQIVQLKADLTETQNRVKQLEAQLKTALQSAQAAPTKAIAEPPKTAAVVTTPPPSVPVAPPAQPAQMKTAPEPTSTDTTPAPTQVGQPWWLNPIAIIVGLIGLFLMIWLSAKGNKPDTTFSKGAKPQVVKEPTKEDEILTKLDMAKAYIEIGNRASARAVLQEILNEGNEKAKKKAKGMLAQLNKAA